MLDTTKEIVIALINNKLIANNDDSKLNINEVRLAIKEIYQEVQNTRFIEPETSNKTNF